MGKEKWGYDYTYDCTGNVNVMRCALEVGYPSSLHHHHHHFLILEMIMFNPGCSPRLGRVLRDWSGGGREGNLNKAVPAGHRKELEGHSLWRLEVEDGGAQAGADRDEGRDGLGTLHHPHIQGLGPGGLTGHLVDFHFILQVNASIDALHSGECLRAIVNIGESDIVQVTLKLSHLFSCFDLASADEAAKAEEQREDGGRVHEAVVALERGQPVRDDLLRLPAHTKVAHSTSPACELFWKEDKLKIR